MSKYVTSRDIADGIKRQVGYSTTQRMIAVRLGVSDAYLSDFLSGRREVGPSILKALGYDTTPHYTKAKP